MTVQSTPAPVTAANVAAVALQTLVAGLISGFLAIVLSIGFASLLLGGDLRVHTPVIVGMALFTTMILNVVGALASPMRGGVSTFQDVPIVAMSSTAAGIAAGMAGSATDDVILATIIVACMVATTLAGVLLFALGIFRLGGLIRFVPYPVVGGFLAGTGWLILQGGITVMLGAPLRLETLGVLAESGTLLKGLVALALVAIVVFLGTRPRDTVLIPVAVLVALIVYNAAVFLSGTPADALRAAGWLVPLPADGKLWPPLTPDGLAAVDWTQVLRSLLDFPGLIIVSVMALLMNATGIELDRGRDGDLDGELRAIGLQNIVSGPTGGLIGYPALSLTLLAARLGAANRGVPLVAAALCAAAILAGNFVLGIVPTPILGGLLVWMGGSLIVTWLIASYRRLPIGEYLIVVLIFLVIVIVGFTPGILFGLIAAIVLFVVEYSRTDVVRNFVRGDAYHSNVDASEERHAALREHGGAIRIFRLQGFLFFGTADNVRRRIVAEVADTPGDDRARFVLVDFERVTGIDSSAVSSFVRLGQMAARDGFAMVFSGANGRTRIALERSGAAAGGAVRFEPNVEQGLAWCENALLDQLGRAAGGGAVPDLHAVLADIAGDAAGAARLAPLFQQCAFEAGGVLIEEGSASDDFFILESGRVTVTIGGNGGSRTPLATLGSGAIVGEVAFYRGKARTARVTAEQPTVAWRFTRASLDRLNESAPDVTARFHHGLARILAERLARTDRLLAFLVD